jgi:hypothetical protein
VQAGLLDAQPNSERDELSRCCLFVVDWPDTALGPPCRSFDVALWEWDAMPSSGWGSCSLKFQQGPRFAAQGHEMAGSGKKISPVRPTTGGGKDEDKETYKFLALERWMAVTS